MAQEYVVGVDSSTQSCKSLSVEISTGRLISWASAPHPDGTQVDPSTWRAAMSTALADQLPGAAAVSVAGQQHGLVALDAVGEVVRPALLWNDTRSAPQAERLRRRHGAGFWATAVGAVPLAALTVSKLAWLAECEPASMERTEEVVLPHDWLTGTLLGRRRELVTDASEASGTGYFDPVARQYREDLIEEAAGKPVRTPRVLGPAEPAGRTADGVLVAAGAADNAAAAFGLELRPGEVVVSLGTSGTVFTVTEQPLADESGEVAGFADCTGRFLPLVCTLNAARVLTQTAEWLGVSLEEFSRLARRAPVDAGGMLLVPYLDGERFPDLPAATGSLLGVTRSTMTPEHLARAATLGMVCGMADALDALRDKGIAVERILLVGGAARSEAVREIVPAIFGRPVELPVPFEYVSRGAARQAAWAVTGANDPPVWGRRVEGDLEPPKDDWGSEVRARFARLRERLYG